MLSACAPAEEVLALYDTDLDGSLNRTEFDGALAAMVRKIETHTHTIK